MGKSYLDTLNERNVGIMTKKRKIIIISCISVLVIILGIITGVYINRKDNKKSNVPNTSMTENKKNKDIENMTEN